jgi:4-hydroxy-tetrahydrodipicolinate synthase
MFSGAYTAIVTPFLDDGSLDVDGLKKLIERQIAGGVSGIGPVGTTGESPTLDLREHCEVIDITIKTVAGRVKVIAGTGGNSTAEAIELTRHAAESGADGTLQVAPYYNKPNQNGLIKHFSVLADIGLPLILYNIPGRSGVSIAIESIVKLADHPKIVAVKEAAGSVERVSDILSWCNIDVLSGDDSLTLPMMSVGAKGVISVASNVIPEQVSRMVKFALADDFVHARQLHQKYFRLFQDLFVDTNPIPVKAALAEMGLIKEVYRLPLCATGRSQKARLIDTMKGVGLL